MKIFPKLSVRQWYAISIILLISLGLIWTSAGVFLIGYHASILAGTLSEEEKAAQATRSYTVNLVLGIVLLVNVLFLVYNLLRRAVEVAEFYVYFQGAAAFLGAILNILSASAPGTKVFDEDPEAPERLLIINSVVYISIHIINVFGWWSATQFLTYLRLYRAEQKANTEETVY